MDAHECPPVKRNTKSTIAGCCLDKTENKKVLFKLALKIEIYRSGGVSQISRTLDHVWKHQDLTAACGIHRTVLGPFCVTSPLGFESPRGGLGSTFFSHKENCPKKGFLYIMGKKRAQKTQSAIGYFLLICHRKNNLKHCFA